MASLGVCNSWVIDSCSLAGVDNGQIWFHNVRVPLDSLLNRFANVSPEGQYSSSISSASQRFGAQYGIYPCVYMI